MQMNRSALQISTVSFRQWQSSLDARLNALLGKREEELGEMELLRVAPTGRLVGTSCSNGDSNGNRESFLLRIRRRDRVVIVKRERILTS